MTSSTRQNEISRFNDPHSGVDVFITSYNVSSAGLNLHHMCSDMVIIGPPPAIPLLTQICARIHRLGQTKECKVLVLILKDSFDEFLISRAVTKYVETMASETPLRHIYGDYGLAFLLILTAIVAAKLSLGFLPFELHKATADETVVAKYFADSVLPNLDKLLDPDTAKVFCKQAEAAQDHRRETSRWLRRAWEKANFNGFKEKPPQDFPFLPQDFEILAGDRGLYNYDIEAIPKGDLRQFVYFLKRDLISTEEENELDNFPLNPTGSDVSSANIATILFSNLLQEPDTRMTGIDEEDDDTVVN
jgi:hypothetical protein